MFEGFTLHQVDTGPRRPSTPGWIRRTSATAPRSPTSAASSSAEARSGAAASSPTGVATPVSSG